MINFSTYHQNIRVMTKICTCRTPDSQKTIMTNIMAASDTINRSLYRSSMYLYLPIFGST